MMLMFQGIINELYPFEKYWTHMLKNKSMPVFGVCPSKFFIFARLRNELFSSEDDTNKYTSDMIGGIKVAADKALVYEIRDETHTR